MMSLKHICCKQIAHELGLEITQKDNILKISEYIFKNLRTYDLSVESRIHVDDREISSCNSLVISHKFQKLEEITNYLTENYNSGNIDEISFCKDLKKKFDIDLKNIKIKNNLGMKPLFISCNESFGERIKHCFQIKEVCYF